MRKAFLIGTGAVLAAAAAIWAADPVFDVASVKPESDHGTGKQAGAASARPGVQTDQGRFAWSESLYGFVLLAYGIQGCGAVEHDPLRCPRLEGGPGWIQSDRFEIEAKIPAGTPAYTPIQFSSGEAPQLQAMLQALLADRFRLRIHHATKELSFYTLAAARGGVKIKPADGTEMHQLMFRVDEPVDQRATALHFTVREAAIRELTRMLGNVLGRPVVDQTGLKGTFDFDLTYDKDLAPPDSAMPAAELGGPGLFEALEKQAGLKLAPAKGPMDVIVIDHVEKLSAN